jgi:hypothetical protein
MSISWGNWSVRVYAAEAWVSLAPRFAVEHAVIVDRLEAILADPVPSVRLQAAQNLQVICEAAPERMWAMAERLAAHEGHEEILAAYLNNSMRRFSHSDPERCEAVLAIAKGRLNADHASDRQGREPLQESLGGWAAQLYGGQGRELARSWLEEWATDPQSYGVLLDSFSSSLRGAFFERYGQNAEAEACAMCHRAQAGLALILRSATTIWDEAYSVLTSDAADSDKQAAGKRCSAAERVIHHAMNQLYFGSGASAADREGAPGLPDAAARARFLTDYADILALIARTRNPATLHHLVELYDFLIPGDPVAVFEAIHAILVGRGEEEGYHYESLGNTAVVSIVRRYIADYRAIFDDEGRRTRLVAILQLFSEAGWPDALKLLYDLPDLMR